MGKCAAAREGISFLSLDAAAESFTSAADPSFPSEGSLMEPADQLSGHILRMENAFFLKSAVQFPLGREKVAADIGVQPEAARVQPVDRGCAQISPVFPASKRFPVPESREIRLPA